MKTATEILIDNGWTVVQRVADLGPCWEYEGAKDGNGYGCMKGKREYAHRVSYQHHTGPIPEGLIIRHRCDNPPCVNPEHLLPGTRRDNLKDMSERGRSTVGEASGLARRTTAEVREMHQLHRAGLTQAQIAERFGLRQGYISKILSGRLWPHIAREEIVGG